MSLDANHLLHFNGVDGTTGTYDLPPISAQQLLALITGEELPDNLAELHQFQQNSSNQHYGVKATINPEDLAEAGWGAVFSSDTDESVIEAMSPLFNLRQSQAGDRFRIFKGEDGIMPEESKTHWLARHGMAPGPADPEVVPYYLLLIGTPVEIPFMFQYQLDVQYAVGRLYFDDLNDYASYAQTVVAAENGSIPHNKRVALMGPEHEDDQATHLSSAYLVKPLEERLKSKFDSWNINARVGEEAGKNGLTEALTGTERPSLLFTASHGMSFPNGDKRQMAHQGALLCSEWPGPKNWRQPIPQDFYVAADDLTSDRGPSGMMAFCHACFGAGVPPLDNFSRKLMRARKALAPEPFVSNLPKRLLGHPKGGALAVVGHVDRAWSYSFDWPQAGRQTAVFESAMATLMEGKPIGMAMEYFNARYAELATALTAELEEIEFGKRPNYQELTANWTAHNDARAYIVLGDPAVRLSPSDIASENPVPILNLDIPEPAKEKAPPKPVEPKAQPETPPAKKEEAPPKPKGPTFVSPKAKHKDDGDESLKSELRHKTMNRLQTALRALDHLDVSTLTQNEDGTETLFAHTHIDLDGKLKQVVSPGEDETQWARHLEAVKVALDNRTAMLEAIARILMDKDPS